MANPTVLKMKEGRVYKAAANVTTGVISRSRISDPMMAVYCTYRIAGQSAPDFDTVKNEAVILFGESDQAKIESSFAIDVYLICGNGDGDNNDWGEVVIWI